MAKMYPVQIKGQPNGFILVEAGATAGGSAGGTSLEFKDEGTTLGASGTVATINFTGAGVTTSQAAGVVTVNVPGGSGFSGAYADLTGKPVLFNGAYVNLTGKPTLFSGVYSDLTGKPVLGTAAATAATDYATAAQGAKADAAQVGVLFKDEAVDLGTSGTATVLDFVGAGVTATRVSNVVTVTIPGGGGGGGSGITRSVLSVAVNTAAGATALTDYVYFVSGTTTLTLPTAVGNTNRYTVQNVGTGVVSIVTTSATTPAQTIHGSTAPITVPIDNSFDLISDGANWRIV